MNITFNTVSNRSYYNSQKQSPSFKAGMPLKSAFLKPLEKGMDKVTDTIADYYTAPFAFSNKITNWLSKREKLDKVVGHMQTAGSFIISGMYMAQTLRNDKLDEDRKKTLAVNQGLTLLFSTAGAYFLDNKLANFWNNNVSDKYVAKHLNLSQDVPYPVERFSNMSADDIKQYAKAEKKWRKEENLRLLKEGLKNHQEKIKKLYLENHPDDIELANFKKPNLMHYIEKGLKNKELTGKLKGLDALKSLLVFGTVYRFVGPVAVTPLANWLGNTFFSGKQPQPIKAENNQSAPIFSAVKPKLDKFLDRQ